MKVALDVSAIPARPAGAGRYVVELASRLPGTGIETTLVTRRGDDARWRAWSSNASIDASVPNPRPVRLAYEALIAGRRRTPSVDLWHGPHYTMPHAARRPTVVTICDMTFFTNPEWHERGKVLFFQRAIRYASVHAHALLSISHTTTQILRDLLSPDVPIFTTPLGVDLNRFQLDGANDETTLRSANLNASAPFLLFVGTFEPRKGLDVLLAAFSDLASAHPELELWLAGQVGWHQGGTSDAIAQHPFASRIRRLGYVDDAVLPALFRAARAVVYPSRGEGFGLPVLEALASGADVVTTRGTVMEEIAGDAARYADAGDAAQVAAAVSDALAESRTSDRQRRARERAAVFSWDSTIAGHVEAYRHVLSSVNR